MNEIKRIRARKNIKCLLNLIFVQCTEGFWLFTVSNASLIGFLNLVRQFFYFFYQLIKLIRIRHESFFNIVSGFFLCYILLENFVEINKLFIVVQNTSLFHAICYTASSISIYTASSLFHAMWNLLHPLSNLYMHSSDKWLVLHR